MAVGTIEDQPFVTCAARCVCSKKSRAKKTRRPAAALLDKGKILEKNPGETFCIRLDTHPCVPSFSLSTNPARQLPIPENCPDEREEATPPGPSTLHWLRRCIVPSIAVPRGGPGRPRGRRGTSPPGGRCPGKGRRWMRVTRTSGCGVSGGSALPSPPRGTDLLHVASRAMHSLGSLRLNKRHGAEGGGALPAAVARAGRRRRGRAWRGGRLS